VQFSTKLTILMGRSGLSQRALAERLQVSNATVAGWCKGARPRPAVAKQIADELGIPVRDLLDDTRELPGSDYAERPEGMDRTLKEVGDEVRQAFTGPDVGWQHYLKMEALFDDMVRERAGRQPSDEEREEFEELMRSFGRGRARGRDALYRATQLATQIGLRVLADALPSVSEEAPGKIRPAKAQLKHAGMEEILGGGRPVPDAVRVAEEAGRRRGFRDAGAKSEKEAGQVNPHKKSG
jgi:transcriptional regulator with XRE-family HTH domain